MLIRRAKLDDIDSVVDISDLMWSGHSKKELEKEYLAIIEDTNAEVFLLCVENQFGVSIKF